MWHKPITVIYFIPTKATAKTVKEGYVSRPREYPELRIYSFDYNLDLSAVKTVSRFKACRTNFRARHLGRAY